MISKCRVLIVDDSVVFRRVIALSLQDQPGIEVVGWAGNGKLALSKIKELDIDLVILDLEMPEMDGIETIKEVRKLNTNIAIIIFSAINEAAAQRTIDALSLGANDFLSKPKSSDGTVETGIDSIRRELVPKILQFGSKIAKNKSAAKVNAATISSKQQVNHVRTFEWKPPHQLKPSVICIGSSTGGPDALVKIFSKLQAPIAVPMLIVQHMPPLFTAQLAIRLAKISAIDVREAQDGAPLLPNRCYVAPGDFHMTVVQRDDGCCVSLNQSEKVCSVRPSVDVCLQSVAKVFGSRVVTFVLTGMGEDGLNGARALKQNRSAIYIQDEKSSVVWGMPGAIFNQELQDAVLDLDGIVQSIQKYSKESLAVTA